MEHNKSMRFAVLLAAYNGEAWLDEQVQSILRQTSVVIDLFISVDKSTDNTKHLVEDLCRKYSNITQLPYGKRYGSASRNFFRLISDVDFSSYDYIAISDQDDIWLDVKLKRAADVLKKYDVAAYSSDVIAFWEDFPKRQIIKKSYRQKKWDFFFESAGPGCSYVLKQSAALKVQEVIRSNHNAVQAIDLHDWLIYAIVRCMGLTWYIDDQATLLYRQHSSNEFGVNSGLAAWKKRFDQIQSGWYKGQIRCLLQLCGGRPETICKAIDGGVSGRLYLLFHVHKLRRRLRDRFVLFVVLLFGIF